MDMKKILVGVVPVFVGVTLALIVAEKIKAKLG